MSKLALVPVLASSVLLEWAAQLGLVAVGVDFGVGGSSSSCSGGGQGIGSGQAELVFAAVVLSDGLVKEAMVVLF